ncbi:hypothetical protein, partial [Candidatus Ichthyocystis sparus]
DMLLEQGRNFIKIELEKTLRCSTILHEGELLSPNESTLRSLANKLASDIVTYYARMRDKIINNHFSAHE